ncbi:hypothetical protein HJC23_008044 [Cyclotella cryptica]|uniref:Uncharacterized protein n=1 Tax=Cyclotella cryptica TaxID=29204 RepID=A0ABD3Q2A8_9STRA|eukprot:CCRYP_009160-RA/>CCRYP_009160-RA protein AED:0.31 eAED:0.31 QI:81/-1/1/1/-1/1/1/327/194
MTLITKLSSALLLLLLVTCNAFSFTTEHRHGITPAPKFIPCPGVSKENSHKIASTEEDNFSRSTSRRNALFTVAASFLAIETNPSKAHAAPIEKGGASSFLGTYTDPINHPGGKRTIQLMDGPSSTGDYVLAQVYGGGGVGEPKEFVLPAIILGDRAIIIDFSPKGGPRDFTGVLEKDGSIRFLRDGNRWPRVG